MKSFALSTVAALVGSVTAYSPNAIAGRQFILPTAANILPPSQDPFYSAPANFESAAPGSILRLRTAAGNLTTVQGNSQAAYQILYRTTDSRYQPSWAVTTLFVPTARSNATNDKLLSYQIAYDSAELDASPSYALYSAKVADISNALASGWYVNVPDYEGPLASFTAGVQSGHATLDSVRAVLNSGFGLVNGTKYAMWGYSGGALASEWAAELQVQYAPELNFSGAALGGLTPNVTSVEDGVSGTLEAGLIPAGILGLASQYPELMAYVTAHLKPTGQYNASTFLAARNQSLDQSIQAFVFQNISNYFINGREALVSPISQYVINRDGVMGYHGVPQMPVFAYKAIGDEVSPVADTDKLVDRYCGVGATILYQRNTVGSHVTEAGNGDARAVQFLTSIFDGKFTQTGCVISNVTVGGS